jgi:capsular exopolysaccharide synthesis family protein
MLLSGQNGSGWRTLVCTSPSPAEGKTTVAANLAVALGKIGKNVLLIDADLSQPSLHHVFRIANNEGLTTLLQSESVSDEAIRAAIQETPQGVSVLTAGPPVSDAADLLFASHMPELLARLKDEFDAILIDTPPAPQMPHARLLGRIADGVILVVRAGRTTNEAVLAALQRLAADRITVLGTVLNDWNPKRSPSEYYGYTKKARRNGRSAPQALARAVEVVEHLNQDRG